MAKLIRPLLFTQHFKIDAAEFEKRNLLDPILNADSNLFIDPLLLGKSENSEISEYARTLLRNRFSKIIELLIASEKFDDAAWKAARRLLDISERKETCLGFGGSSVSGSSRPDALKNRILKTTLEIVRIGIKNPEIIALMGFLEDDVGPDTISDLTSNAIWPALAKITGQFCADLKIKTRLFYIDGQEVYLPSNPTQDNVSGILLVPRDVLRNLPIAADISDVGRVAFENKVIRDRVNALLADYAKATVSQKKKALKESLLESSKNFLDLFEALIRADEPYNVLADPAGLYAFRETLREVAKNHPFQIAQLRAKSQSELTRVVNMIVAQFKDLVENKDLYKLLWNKDAPRNEKAAQLLFYGVAEAYCRANNIEISPETNMGGGPVDFKFSKGGSHRMLVEIKLSTGRVVHGYEKQLAVYQAAAGDCDAALLIVNVGKLGTKLAKIKRIREQRLKANQNAADIFVVDGGRKSSASLR